MSTTDTELLAFKAIAKFTMELSELFGDKQRSLKLYSRLVSKTTIAHEKPIAKHIDAFRNFCVANREALKEKDEKRLQETDIVYSDKVFIRIPDVLKAADSQTKKVIWEHLLLISALLDPAGKAKDMLAKSETNEANFLTDILDKVEGEFDPNASPMEAMSSIMQSGVFTDLITNMNSGLQDGSLDMERLMSTVQKVVTDMSSKSGNVEGGNEAMSMINNMMSTMMQGQQAGGEEGSEAPPNIMAMMGPLMAGMSGGGGNRSIEEQIENAASQSENSRPAISDVTDSTD